MPIGRVDQGLNSLLPMRLLLLAFGQGLKVLSRIAQRVELAAVDRHGIVETI
jgi:hypothetical protein